MGYKTDFVRPGHIYYVSLPLHFPNTFMFSFFVCEDGK